MPVSPAPYARHMNCGPLPVSKSVRITPHDVSLKPSARPPPTQDPKNRPATLVTTAAETLRATPSALAGLAAIPTALAGLVADPTTQMAHVMEMVLMIAAATPTILTAAHDGDWLTNLSLLKMSWQPLLDLPHPAPHRPPHRIRLPLPLYP